MEKSLRGFFRGKQKRNCLFAAERKLGKWGCQQRKFFQKSRKRKMSILKKQHVE
jgi:hypothetical protein